MDFDKSVFLTRWRLIHSTGEQSRLLFVFFEPGKHPKIWLYHMWLTATEHDNRY